MFPLSFLSFPRHTISELLFCTLSAQQISCVHFVRSRKAGFTFAEKKRGPTERWAFALKRQRTQVRARRSNGLSRSRRRVLWTIIRFGENKHDSPRGVCGIPRSAFKVASRDGRKWRQGIELFQVLRDKVGGT